MLDRGLGRRWVEAQETLSGSARDFVEDCLSPVRQFASVDDLFQFVLVAVEAELAEDGEEFFEFQGS